MQYMNFGLYLLVVKHVIYELGLSVTKIATEHDKSIVTPAFANYLKNNVTQLQIKYISMLKQIRPSAPDV